MEPGDERRARRRSSYQARLVAATSAPGRARRSGSAPARRAAWRDRAGRSQRRGRVPSASAPASASESAPGLGRAPRWTRPLASAARRRRPAVRSIARVHAGLAPHVGRDRARVAVDAGRRRDRLEERGEPPFQLVELRLGRRAIDDRADEAVGEHRPQRRVDRLELQLAQRLVQRRHPAPRQPPRQPAHWPATPSGTSRNSQKTCVPYASSETSRPRSRISRHERRYSSPVRASRKMTNAAGSCGRPSPSASDRRTSRFAPLAVLRA